MFRLRFPSLFSRLFLRTVTFLGLIALLGWASIPDAARAQHPTAVTSIVNSASDTTLEVNHDGGLLVPGKFDDPIDYSAPADSIPAEGSGIRMMWYPAKAAFRAGQVGSSSGKGDVWDADSVGEYSVAFGVDTKADGTGTLAMGHQTTASGDYAMAVGYEATALGNHTTALGSGATTRFFASTAIGHETRATARYATAMGTNTTASAPAATALGSHTMAIGNQSLSAGQYAKATHNHTFIWADGSDSAADKFSSGDDANGSGVTGPQTFQVKASDGVRFITDAGTTFLNSSSTGWNTSSARVAKTNIESANSMLILAAVKSMPISIWEYDSTDHGVRHIGPMAGDFHSALPYDLGSSEKYINSINADGVAIAAIKGLARKVERKKSAIHSLRDRVRQLETQNKRVAHLKAESNHSVLAGLFGSVPTGLGLVLAALGGGLASGLFLRQFHMTR